MTRQMTPGAIDMWRALFAASWHQTGWKAGTGLVSDDERARWCAREAARALDALHAIADAADGTKESEQAAEVLR